MKSLIGEQIILLGIILIVLGIVVKFGFPLGRLPGDIHIKGDNFNFYFPLTTSILLSLLLTVIFKLFR